MESNHAVLEKINKAKPPKRERCFSFLIINHLLYFFPLMVIALWITQNVEMNLAGAF